jgi:hypothetical protein
MWDDDAPLVLWRLKEYYLKSYAALPSNTHLVESNLKDANLCQIKGLGENLSSAFSTTRSGRVGALNDNYIAAFRNQGIIKGNNTVTSGKYGTRKYRKDGSEYIEKDSKMRVNGSLRSQEAIKLVIKKHKQIAAKLTLPANKAKWLQLREGISKKMNQFD